jgi:hypothetical protein
MFVMQCRDRVVAVYGLGSVTRCVGSERTLLLLFGTQGRAREWMAHCCLMRVCCIATCPGTGSHTTHSTCGVVPVGSAVAVSCVFCACVMVHHSIHTVWLCSHHNSSGLGCTRLGLLSASLLLAAAVS